MVMMIIKKSLQELIF